MKNKIYASTVFLLLFMFFAANCFAADGNMNIYSGADETEYTRNVNLFAHLGIFDAAAEIDSVVTRADFVEKVLVKGGGSRFPEEAFSAGGSGHDGRASRDAGEPVL